MFGLFLNELFMLILYSFSYKNFIWSPAILLSDNNLGE